MLSDRLSSRGPGVAELTTAFTIDNEARAFRVVELIQDFSNIQHTLSQIDDRCHPQDYYLRGYAILRQCRADGHALLQMHQSTSPLDAPNASPEVAKTQLLR